jgi:CubicO group peptidase (beta-lactamase class C family)
MRNKIVVDLCLISLLLLLFSSSVYAQTSPVMDQSVFTEIDDYINSQMTTYRIPGLALAVIHKDQIIYMQGYGVAGPSGEPVTPKTTFIIGSTGKSITASAMMMLVDAGQVDLDASVQQYLPWFRLADESSSAKITVRMLLNHTSGLPNGAGWVTQGYSDLSDNALEKLVRSFSTVRLNHEPGTAYEYANANYQVAGMIVQAVSGVSFQTFIQQHIYDPLEMNNSYTSRDEARKHGMATGYRYWFGYPLPANNLPYSYGQFPAGWYICSVEDLAHYLVMHMNEGRYAGETLISKDGMEVLHQPVLNDYAMGWVVEDNLISHNGGMPDYGSGLYFDTATHYGVVVAFNANAGYFYTPTYVIAPSVLRILSGGQPLSTIPDAWYRAMLIGLVITLSLQVIWLIVSISLTRRWRQQREKFPKRLLSKLVWLILPLLIELGLTYYIISTFQANGWTVLVRFIYYPDLTLLAVISLFLALGWGVARTIISIQMMIKPKVALQ